MQMVVFKENLGFFKCVSVGPKRGVRGPGPGAWAALASTLGWP